MKKILIALLSSICFSTSAYTAEMAGLHLPDGGIYTLYKEKWGGFVNQFNICGVTWWVHNDSVANVRYYVERGRYKVTFRGQVLCDRF